MQRGFWDVVQGPRSRVQEPSRRRAIPDSGESTSGGVHQSPAPRPVLLTVALLLAALVPLGCDDGASGSPASRADSQAGDSQTMEDSGRVTPDSGLPPEDTNRRDRSDTEAVGWPAVEAAIEASALTDLTVLVGNADGELFQYSKGDSSPDTLYALASASKWLSAITALKMVEAGLWSLSDRPQDHLAWWPADENNLVSAITLEQLLSFTSGFTGGTGLSPLDTGIPCIEEADTTIAACAQAILEGGYHQYPAGTAFFYGPAHMQIAGAMASETTGKRWHRLFRDYVGNPLGLDVKTGFALPSLDNPRVGGGGTSSARDYGRILQALLAGELLSPSSLELLVKDHTPEGVLIAKAPGAATDGRSWHYALGCWRECGGDTYTPACDKAGIVSSPGAFGFYPWWDQDRGYWGIVARQANAIGGDLSIALGHSLQDLISAAVETP